MTRLRLRVDHGHLVAGLHIGEDVAGYLVVLHVAGFAAELDGSDAVT